MQNKEEIILRLRALNDRLQVESDKQQVEWIIDFIEDTLDDKQRVINLKFAFSRLLSHYETQLVLTDQNKIDDYPEIKAARKALKEN